MSRAFVREPDDIPPEPLAELPVSPHPNHVTERGLLLIDARLDEVQAALEAADDKDRPPLRRDLRYWSARRATAQVAPSQAGSTLVGFGSRVTIRRQGRKTEVVRIVGEDEADPAAGLVSWTSPLAAALIGAEAGEVVEIGAREPPLEVAVVKVDNRLKP